MSDSLLNEGISRPSKGALQLVLHSRSELVFGHLFIYGNLLGLLRLQGEMVHVFKLLPGSGLDRVDLVKSKLEVTVLVVLGAKHLDLKFGKVESEKSVTVAKYPRNGGI